MGKYKSTANPFTKLLSQRARLPLSQIRELIWLHVSCEQRTHFTEDFRQKQLSQEQSLKFGRRLSFR